MRYNLPAHTLSFINAVRESKRYTYVPFPAHKIKNYCFNGKGIIIIYNELGEKAERV